jgi:hypothetical protein
MSLTEYLDESLKPWKPRQNQLSEAETESLRKNATRLIEWGYMVSRVELAVMGMMEYEATSLHKRKRP